MSLQVKLCEPVCGFSRFAWLAAFYLCRHKPAVRALVLRTIASSRREQLLVTIRLSCMLCKSSRTFPLADWTSVPLRSCRPKAKPNRHVMKKRRMLQQAMLPLVHKLGKVRDAWEMCAKVDDYLIAGAMHRAVLDRHPTWSVLAPAPCQHAALRRATCRQIRSPLTGLT